MASRKQQVQPPINRFMMAKLYDSIFGMTIEPSDCPARQIKMARFLLVFQIKVEFRAWRRHFKFESHALRSSRLVGQGCQNSNSCCISLNSHTLRQEITRLGELF